MVVDMHDDVIGAMRQQKAAAETKNTSFVPFWFRLADKQKALIRPLVNLNSSDKVAFHHFYDQGLKKYVDAVCASVNGLPCLYCEASKMAETKRSKADYAPKEVFILPTWLHAILAKKVDESGMEVLGENDNPVWEKMTYTDPETQEQKLVCGLRFIRLSFKDSTKDVLEKLLDFYEKGGDLRLQDFVIERQGGDQHTKYVPSKRQPSPFKAYTGEAFTRAIIRARVLESAPMSVIEGGPSTDPAVDAVTQGVKNGQKAQQIEELDDVPVF